MKYSEFKTEVESMGFEVIGNHWMVSVLDAEGICICRVSKEYVGAINSFMPIFFKVDKLKKFRLLELIYFLAKTPLEEREEEEPTC